VASADGGGEARSGGHDMMRPHQGLYDTYDFFFENMLSKKMSAIKEKNNFVVRLWNVLGSLRPAPRAAHVGAAVLLPPPVLVVGAAGPLLLVVITYRFFSSVRNCLETLTQI